MAEIIKKEVIKVPNGQLLKLCRKYNTSISELSRETKIKDITLRKFNTGERTLSWDRWEKITNYLDTLKK